MRTAAQPGRPRVTSSQAASIGRTYSDSNCAQSAETYQVGGTSRTASTAATAQSGPRPEAPAHDGRDPEVGERRGELDERQRDGVVRGGAEQAGRDGPQEPPGPGQDGREGERLVIGPAQAVDPDGPRPGEEVVHVAGQAGQRQEDGADRQGDGEAQDQREPLAPPEAAPGRGAQARSVRQYRSAEPLTPPSSAVFAP